MSSANPITSRNWATPCRKCRCCFSNRPLLPAGGTILLPPLSQQVEQEGELGVVIGRRCQRLASGADVRPFIFGFTAVNDVTARDMQNCDPQWTRAKGFDTFCPVGPVLAVPPAPTASGPGQACGLKSG